VKRTERSRSSGFYALEPGDHDSHHPHVGIRRPYRSGAGRTALVGMGGRTTTREEGALEPYPMDLGSPIRATAETERPGWAEDGSGG
jgi:hypothetical protein